MENKNDKINTKENYNTNSAPTPKFLFLLFILLPFGTLFFTLPKIEKIYNREMNKTQTVESKTTSDTTK